MHSRALTINVLEIGGSKLGITEEMIFSAIYGVALDEME